MRVGRCASLDQLGQGEGSGVAIEILTDGAGQVDQVEGGQLVQVALARREELDLTPAQHLQRGAEATPGSESPFGDGAHYPELTRREADDLGGFAVAQSREDDGL
jgi:hypothetical protein